MLTLNTPIERKVLNCLPFVYSPPTSTDALIPFTRSCADDVPIYRRLLRVLFTTTLAYCSTATALLPTR